MDRQTKERDDIPRRATGRDARHGRSGVGVPLLALLLLLPSAVAASEIGPDEDWCRAVATLRPGEELVLRPGEYAGGCAIRHGGEAGAPIVIRARDVDRPPRLVYLGATRNVIDVRASHVVIRGLHLANTRQGVDGIKIYGVADVTIEDCRFTDLGGIAVAASGPSSRGLVVRRNVVTRTRATAMYFGCHDGVRCTVTGIVVESNYIDGVEAPDREIGYGVQVKLNSSGVIRDNVVLNTKGPGIMVYGTTGGGSETVVESNFAAGSRTSAGVVVAGGPVTVANNIAVRNAGPGIAVEDYHGRGFLHGVVLTGNTVYGNAGGGIGVPRRRHMDVAIYNNAVHALVGSAGLPAPAPGIRLQGNVDCSLLVCFRAPESLDFSPVPGSPVTGRGVVIGAEAAARDYFGRRRRLPPTVGAVETAAGPVHLGVKLVD